MVKFFYQPIKSGFEYIRLFTTWFQFHMFYLMNWNFV